MRSVYHCPGRRSLALRNRALVLGGVADPTCLCEQPEACCLGGGECEELTPSECVRRRGQPRGPGTTCAGVDCLGSCCESAGNCTRTGFAPCYEQLGGVWGGFGTTCSPNPCPVFGACCQSGDCTQTTAGNCPGLWFQGVACSSNPCPPACCLANTCCYTPNIGVSRIATLTTQFTVNYSRCCGISWLTCPTHSVTDQATQNLGTTVNQCQTIPIITLTTLAQNQGPMPCTAANCPTPWVGWNASLAVESFVCSAGNLTFNRRLRINTDTVTTSNQPFNCAAWQSNGTHNENLPELCGGVQRLMSFGYSSTLAITNLLPCHPAMFRFAEYRTSAGGVLVPGDVLPGAGMRIKFSSDGSVPVVLPGGGCSGCGGLLTGGGALI